MAENKNEVAEATSTAISTFDDSLLSGGTGLEDTTTEDFAIPLLEFYNLCHHKCKSKTEVM